jgi:hypothetical protein
MKNYLISPLVSRQLPDFVRSEYGVFVTFLEKYYEWMEQSGQLTKSTQELASSFDLDDASDFYVDQIKKEFLPYFPESITLDKRKFLKLINQFYSAKGTPNSVKFLFRALFGEEIEIYYPKDDILKVSDGKWVLPLALRIDTDDNNIFNIEKTKLTGRTSQATALVEKVIKSVDRQLGISYIEVYISNVDKLFTTGETVYSYFNDGVADVLVEGRLIGALSEIKIDPNNRGLFYNAYDTTTGYSGDPITIVGGLNPNANTPIGAIAYVGETTQGGITDVVVTDGGFGFRDPTAYPNSSIFEFSGGFDNAPLGTEASAKISLLDNGTYRTMNVSNTTLETILNTTISTVENTAINAVSTFQTLNVYPISFVSLTGQGGGYRTKPETDLYSFYLEQNEDVLVISTANILKDTNTIYDYTQDLTVSFEIGDLVRLYLNNRFEDIREVTGVYTNYITVNQSFRNDIVGISVYKILRNDIKKLGSLGRIQIVDGGQNYAVNQYLTFSGGIGYGANAKITAVHSSNNGIKTIEFQEVNGYLKGGEGYTPNELPTITINTVSGTNAIVRITEVTGDGESMNVATSKIGAISKIRVISYGYDYVAAPTISLRNADLQVSNVTAGQLFVSGTSVYQGSSNTTASFIAYVDKYDPDTKLLRLYDYIGGIDTTLQIKSNDGLVSAKVDSVNYYGDGRAKATASFENGLIRLPGIYVNTDGQLSADKVIQDGEKYHNFSYIISTNQDFAKFKKPLADIVHPMGTKTFVTRVENMVSQVSSNVANKTLSVKTIPVTLNISNTKLNAVTTNSQINVANSVSTGDIVTFTSVNKRISGTVNVSGNTLYGTSTNFINDLLDGDLIYISTGNTVTVSNVVSANVLVLQNTINVSANAVYVNVVFNDTKTVSGVNANTILVSSAFTTNSSFVTATVQKVK